MRGDRQRGLGVRRFARHLPGPVDAVRILLAFMCFAAGVFGSGLLASQTVRYLARTAGVAPDELTTDPVNVAAVVVAMARASTDILNGIFVALGVGVVLPWPSMGAILVSICTVVSLMFLPAFVGARLAVAVLVVPLPSRTDSQTD